MKNLLILITIMLVGGCAATPTVKSVAGTYELKEDEDGKTYKAVMLENGIGDHYRNGKKVKEFKWSISKEGELHFAFEDGSIAVLRINKDGSITTIALINKDGKRTERPKVKRTYKKIK